VRVPGTYLPEGTFRNPEPPERLARRNGILPSQMREIFRIRDSDGWWIKESIPNGDGSFRRTGNWVLE